MGVEAQERLLASTMLVVGAGGLGSPASLYLAAAGVGRILLADDDEVDLTNLQRQILHRQDRVGEPKAESGRRSLLELNPGIEVLALPRRLAGDDLLQQVARADVVLDCCDNFATRHAINRACVQAGVPLVSGAADPRSTGSSRSSMRASPSRPATTACFRKDRTWKRCAAPRWACSRR